MRSQLLFYKFDTKSKPDRIVCHGIRFETFETSADDDLVRLPLLCDANLAHDGIDVKAFKTAINQNL